ncbi:hypothetical protein T492DRAFT_1022973 [Pavlovales sp. CCMP2436]|nr:hypothetical protein T492DRAFT_1022973 [Pavlovales sp. CCMP2436]
MASMECESYYPDLKSTALRRRGLVGLTTSRESDVPLTYLRAGSVASWGRRPPAFDAQRLRAHVAAGGGLLSLVASNCAALTPRQPLFAELRRLLGGRAESLGRCGRTAPWPSCAGGRPCSKHGALRLYPFYFAAENSAVTDYFTEKAFDALEAGVVPIYFGAPNGHEFLPPGSAIFVDAQLAARNLSGAAHVIAAQLLALAADPHRYAELLAWRRRPLDTAYAQRWAPFVGTKMHCRLCRYAYVRRHAAGNVSWDATEQFMYLV